MARKKILIMDDDPTIADLLTEALADEGYETFMTTQSLRFFDAVRRKKNASMNLALQLVRDGKAVGAVSAGNSGAMMAASLFILKRIPGVDRPALGGLFPTIQGACLIIDMGA